jgi:hypothetical protein
MIFGCRVPTIAVQKPFRLIQPQTGTCMQPTKMVDEFKRVVVWKNLLLNGRDYCCLWHTAEGWLLKGHRRRSPQRPATDAGELRNPLR